MSGRLPTTLRWLLIGSLALNVALLAGIGWRQFDHRTGPHGQVRHHVRATMLPSPQRLRNAVPESRRPLVDEVLQRHRGPIRESVRGVFEARGRVHALLTAERIDPAELEQAFAALRERDAEAARAVQAMMTELAQRLTPEERRALAEGIRRHPRLRGDRGRGAGPGD